MSEANDIEAESEAEAREENREASDESAIGVYYVTSDELVESPSDRTYRRRVLWTGDGWTPTSNGELVQRAPDERTLDAFIDEFGGRNYFVMSPDDVPGTAAVEEPRFGIDDLDLDVPVADTDGDGTAGRG